ncbi:DMT family transporter [Deefgea tanakiae]|uniref:DMT family transporter n=1 Tax=Deefgea tanakiae TaxID=2865840 RepID=A0ABX8Z4D9_9NEIS|nr:DMT family transporter [Deefgea tanakiae]QZA77433.1 DMT family transporter [Deefgea tanakiae]
MRHRLPLPELMLFAVALVWGCSYGVAKMALIYYPVLGFLALRFGLTFALLLPSLRDFRSAEVQSALRIGLPLGLILLAIFLCETYGIAQTSAANAAFLISLCIVLTPLVEWLRLKQRPDSFTMGAALVAMLGAALLSSNLNAAFNLGDALILAAALLRALMMVETKRRCAGQALSTLALTAVQSGVLMVGCLLLALLMPSDLPALPTSPTFWLATIFLVLFCTLFAFFAQNYAIRRSTPSRVALLLGTEPVFGALFAALILGETLSTNVIFGGALIVLASLAASLQVTGTPRESMREAV